MASSFMGLHPLLPSQDCLVCPALQPFLSSGLVNRVLTYRLVSTSFTRPLSFLSSAMLRLETVDPIRDHHRHNSHQFMQSDGSPGFSPVKSSQYLAGTVKSISRRYCQGNISPVLSRQYIAGTVKSISRRYCQVNISPVVSSQYLAGTVKSISPSV